MYCTRTLAQSPLRNQLLFSHTVCEEKHREETLCLVHGVGAINAVSSTTRREINGVSATKCTGKQGNGIDFAPSSARARAFRGREGGQDRRKPP
eukprot:2182155-Rhodomonas_salina.3